jgi:hypothetical protein
MKLRVPQKSGNSRGPRRAQQCVVIFAAILALALTPAVAVAASPILEFVAPGHSLPVPFTTEGGAVTAEMAGFQILMKCTASHGEGEITGPRTTISNYRFTGCTAAEGATKCKSAGAQEEEITAGPIEGDLVYIDQTKREAGILLNPGGGTYVSFKCGNESAEGRGSFLAPVSPIDQEATLFTATLNQSDSVQLPDEYENENGERLQAIPTGRRESNKFVPTGVELAMSVRPSVPVEVKAISPQEIQAKQQQEEVKLVQANLTKLEQSFKQYEERAKQAAEEAKQHEVDANAQIAAAAKKQQEAEAAATKAQKEVARGLSLARALRECEKQPKNRRVRCVVNALKRDGGSPQVSRTPAR